jgi:AcrR family transcriptional regulator
MDGSGSQASRARPGEHQLRREVVVHHQRERMLAAVIEVVAEQGYRAVSVGDIVKRAAIARAKFYENFSSKEDCFLAAYDRASADLVQRAAEACKQVGDSIPERMSATLAVGLDYFASNPALARACIVEAPAAGPVTETRREQVLTSLAEVVRGPGGQADEEAFPKSVQDSVFGGIFWLLYHAVLGGRPADLNDLLPELTEFALIPFVGADEARRAARSLSPSAN